MACDSGYFLDTNSTCTACQTPNCQLCSSPTSCQHCLNGYYLQDNQTCVGCGNACLTCSQEQGCQECSGSYYLADGQCKQCEHPCMFCMQDPNNTNTYYCSECYSTEYTAIDGQCLLCSEVSQGCSTCAGQSECYTCAMGYYLLGGECVPDQGGLATIYIVLISIAGVIGLAAIVFGVVACWRSRTGYGAMGEAGGSADGVRASYYEFP